MRMSDQGFRLGPGNNFDHRNTLKLPPPAPFLAPL
jgi:hypothetical protein